MTDAQRRHLLLATLLGLGLTNMPGDSWGQADSSRSIAAVIDDYVASGLKANLGLQSRSLELERAQAALDAARAGYMPQLDFAARYTRAEGGRQITVPLASALNPVYTSLNELLVAAGRPGEFPQIEDRGFSLIREREQDTRLSLRQPLIAPAIPAAVRANRALLGASDYARIAFARRLKRDIAVGYLNWLAATKTRGIVQASLTLLEENLRVNDSLFRNGKITQDQVLRAKAELLAVTQQLREAENGIAQAASYLNFLLNRPLASPLDAADARQDLAVARTDLAQLRSLAMDRRPELAQLGKLERASAEQLRIARTARWPTLSLGADAGIQGERYEFGSGRNFGTLSLLLNWSLFDGGARAAEVRRAAASVRQAQLQREQTAQQIQLEVQQALDQLLTANDSLATAEARTTAAQAAFRIAAHKRDAGAISQVEFIDARASLASAELNLNVTRFGLLARQAELDYATASGDLPL
ncbi:MAG: TolC family protein [Pseudomonadales bacterium]|nr:TolC family protein [Pseudomonadales bacterium]